MSPAKERIAAEGLRFAMLAIGRGWSEAELVAHIDGLPDLILSRDRVIDAAKEHRRYVIATREGPSAM